MNGLYDQFLVELMKGNIDLDGHILKIALLDANHTFDKTDEGWAAIAANEVSGIGYTEGGVPLSNVTILYEDGKCKLDGDDITWETSTITASAAVLYDDVHPTKCLIASWDLTGAPLSSLAGNFTLTLDALGALYIS